MSDQPGGIRSELLEALKDQERALILYRMNLPFEPDSECTCPPCQTIIALLDEIIRLRDHLSRQG